MIDIKKILYVEDEEDIQTIARIALEDIGGFTLEVCSSGEEALQKAEAFGPDLMLLDVMMPGLDGPATLASLRKIDALKDVPAIFMTAKVQPHEVEHFKSIGAVDVIAKPFDPMTLAQTLKEVVNNV
ncbi:MAG TPA: response regulator [Epsilonproteobacteria bacterium]|nr:response regulator [Campylobacterota bacterium]